MKKVLLFALVLLISVAFVGTGFAQEKAKAPEKPAVDKPAAATEEKPAEAQAPEKAAEKPKPKPMPGFVGKVVMTDTVYKTVSVQRGKEIVSFDISDAKYKGYKNFDQVGEGDKVAMIYKKGALTMVKIAGAKKAKADKKPADVKKPAKKAKDVKKDEKKEEKPEEKK